MPKFVSGDISTGVLRLYREDGTNQYGRVIAFLGTVTDVVGGEVIYDRQIPRR